MLGGRHYREPIPYGEYLKLLWNVEHRCVVCGRKPPDVVLHIDHIEPVKRGGKSRARNLQFMCQEDNLRKGSQTQEGRPWLNLD